MERRKVLMRAFGTLLGAVFTLSLFSISASVSNVRAQGSDDAYSTKTVYHWVRIYEQSDFPAMNEEVHCLLCWARDGVAYCNSDTVSDGEIVGRALSSDPYLDCCMTYYASDPYDQGWIMDFYTTSTKNTWTMKVVGRDSVNANIPMVEFRNSTGSMLYAADTDELGFTTGSVEDSEDYKFSIATNDADTAYGDWCNYGRTKIFLKRSNAADIALKPKNNHVILERYIAGGWDYGDADDIFALYVCREEQIPAIKTNYTVKSGNTFQLKSDAYLDDNVTLTIEPGAVVTLDGFNPSGSEWDGSNKGKFYNNGKIENYGTLILYEGATMYYHDPKSAEASSITNYGSKTTYTDENGVKMQGEGNLIVMKGAKLLLQNADNSGGSYNGPTLEFKDGSTLVNYGIVASPFRTVFHGCHLLLHKEGHFLARTNITKRLGVLYDMTAEDMDDYGLQTVPTSGNSFLPSVNYVDSYGTWRNQELGELYNNPNVVLKTNET